jgi:GTP-binding protein HflX
MPFATLDPTTRKMELPDGYSVFLTDTVGFIRKLPTTLVAAFRSTLEEVTGADIVLHLIDASHPEWDIQRDAVMDTLEVLKAQDKPMLTIFNKVDQLPYGTDLDEMLSQFPNSVAISALNGEGIPELLAMLKEMVQQYLGYIVALVPYEQSRLVSDCYRFGRVLRADYRDEGILVEAELVAEMRGVMSAYQVDPAMLQT